MSGHSKWSTIKHGKAITDARRGKLFSKLTREILVAAKQGGGNTDMNVRLRLAVQKARDNNMPVDNIERAIKRATGEGNSQDQLEEILYEGYGPGGAAILLQAFTDNRNRTASEIRSTFAKNGGNLGESGCVAWIFEQKGVITLEAPSEEAEELALMAIDLGADDFNIDNSNMDVYSAPNKFEELRKSLEENKLKISSAELSMLPKNTTPLDDKTAEQTLRLLDKLEDLDDVQKVYSNADFPEEVLTKYAEEA